MATRSGNPAELAQLWTVCKLVGLGILVNQHFAQITVVRACVRILSLLSRRVVRHLQCKGPSMLPTMNKAGDVLFVDKLTFKFRDVKRNEIVIAASPHKPGEEVCKRVIGLVSQRSPRFMPKHLHYYLEFTQPGDIIHVGGSHVRLKVCTNEARTC